MNMVAHTELHRSINATTERLFAWKHALAWGVTLTLPMVGWPDRRNRSCHAEMSCFIVSSEMLAGWLDEIKEKTSLGVSSSPQEKVAWKYLARRDRILPGADVVLVS